MHCPHHEAGRCRSCTLLPLPYLDQLARKESHVRSLVAAADWLPTVRSAEAGFRNKAKMVVAGSVAAPTLGILRPDGRGVDLRDCGLHEPAILAALPVLADWIAGAALTPYDVAARRGELKHLLVTGSPDGRLMVRLVLRSTEAESRIRKHLPALLAALPRLAVVSLNVQPEHKAVLEGDREIQLHGDTLPMPLGNLTLHLRPQSFFQTNTAVARELYGLASTWTDRIAPVTVLDLYCGVGGFALHLAAPGREVCGVEVSEQAVASARRSAAEAGVAAEFVAADATVYAESGGGPQPDLVVVNPPRRGVGSRLATWLEGAGVPHVLYSSCRAETLARDLAAMPSLRPVEAVLLDMFPQTDHYEVLVRLERG